MTTIERVYVLSGTFAEFRRYCRDSRLLPGRDAVFVAAWHTLRGEQPPIQLVYYGTWRNRIDAHKVCQVVEEINQRGNDPLTSG